MFSTTQDLVVLTNIVLANTISVVKILPLFVFMHGEKLEKV